MTEETKQNEESKFQKLKNYIFYNIDFFIYKHIKIRNIGIVGNKVTTTNPKDAIKQAITKISSFPTNERKLSEQGRLVRRNLILSSSVIISLLLLNANPSQMLNNFGIEITVTSPKFLLIHFIALTFLFMEYAQFKAHVKSSNFDATIKELYTISHLITELRDIYQKHKNIIVYSHWNLNSTSSSPTLWHNKNFTPIINDYLSSCASVFPEKPESFKGSIPKIEDELERIDDMIHDDISIEQNKRNVEVIIPASFFFIAFILLSGEIIWEVTQIIYDAILSLNHESHIQFFPFSLC